MSEDSLVPKQKVRGLVLLSGGLDSTLAICVMTVGGGQEHMTVAPIVESQVERCRIK